MLHSEEIIAEVVSRVLLKEIAIKDVADGKTDVFLTETKRAAI